MARDGVVIIKKGGGAGHHGGAWKVAYADFVTAMMAFFLLMWLINTTSPEQKRGIADYFAAHNISQSQSGAGGVMGGTVFATEGARVGGGISQISEQLPPQPRREDDDTQGGANDNDGSEDNGLGGTAFSQGQADETMQRQRPSFDDGQFEQAAVSLRQAMQRMPEIAELSQQLLMEQTTEGLNIQLVDQDGRAMFELGTANLLPAARRVLQQVAKIVDRLPNRIAITGHTDAAPFQGPNGTTNWELSAARANAARAVLAMEGVQTDRIFHVSGKAGTDPLIPDNPYSSSNRRISILLMREAPVVPPGYKL